jgi:hypothetical protein
VVSAEIPRAFRLCASVLRNSYTLALTDTTLTLWNEGESFALHPTWANPNPSMLSRLFGNSFV